MNKIDLNCNKYVFKLQCLCVKYTLRLYNTVYTGIYLYLHIFMYITKYI